MTSYLAIVRRLLIIPLIILPSLAFGSESCAARNQRPDIIVCGGRLHFDGGSLLMPGGYERIDGKDRVRFSFSGIDVLDVRVARGAFEAPSEIAQSEEPRGSASGARVFVLRGTRAPVVLLVYQSTTSTWIQVSATSRSAAESFFASFVPGALRSVSSTCTQQAIVLR